MNSIGSPPLDAAGQMGLDEALLDSVASGSSPGRAALLRFYRWSGPAATLGYFQPYLEASEETRVRGMGGVPLVRRPTGGGLVLHDGDVTFSLVFPWPCGTAPQAVYKDLHRSVHLGLKAVGFPTRLWSPGAVPEGGGPSRACFPDPVPMDVVTEGGRKVLGGALRRRRGWGLYQGSLRPEATGADAEEVRRAVARGLAGGGEPEDVPSPPGVLERGAALAKTRYSTQAWNRRY